MRRATRATLVEMGETRHRRRGGPMAARGPRWDGRRVHSAPAPGGIFVSVRFLATLLAAAALLAGAVPVADAASTSFAPLRASVSHAHDAKLRKSVSRARSAYRHH